MRIKPKFLLQFICIAIVFGFLVVLFYQYFSNTGVKRKERDQNSLFSLNVYKPQNLFNRVDNDISLQTEPFVVETIFEPRTEISKNLTPITLEHLFISVKTTKGLHKSRLDLIIKTWFTLARNQTWFFTDTEDKGYFYKTGGHFINTNCTSSHSRTALCCKMAAELDAFLQSDKKWWCHFDDDNYVNVPTLVRMLQKYEPLQDWYLGKPSIRVPLEIISKDSASKKISFWFATGGAGFCISRPLALKMLPVASGGKFISIGEEIRLPDDVTMGYVIEHLLNKRLTIVEEFHSHLEPMRFISKEAFPYQITFSYSKYGSETNIVRVEGLDVKLDPTRSHVVPRREQHWQSIYTLDPINSNEATFNKILIANRGEIACRVIKTAKKMGIKTVAVHSDVDSYAPHVKLADEAFCLGTAQAKDSYLRMDKILEAIDKTNSEAVHPGYGFLSENAHFVKTLEERNITFIGPCASAITGMGDKLQSKRLAIAAKVNTIPGFDGIIKNEEECVKLSKEIGFPVMIKASAGGGGKGMRIAWNDDEAREGFKLSSQEAASSFGDDRILVEKFVDNPRHIEIQVLGDKHGNAVYLNERECSIQRRNQKVIEESPSTFLDPATRKAMGEQAVSLAKQIKYDSAGTVEFLLDSQRNFYFLEMNTRLQVEHPITECTTGVDLVHQMIRVAKGHPLNITQKDVSIRGWAIENRVYAEDPFKNFGLPSIGRLSKYEEPNFMSKVRCDSGVEEGSDISIYYDPMICKLVCYGDTREEAISRSIKALDAYVIRGVTHNIPLLRDILTEKNFLRGNITTKYLYQVYADGFNGKQLSTQERNELVSILACIHAKNNLRSCNYIGAEKQVSTVPGNSWNVVIRLQSEDVHCKVELTDTGFMVAVGSESFMVKDNFNLANSLIYSCVNDSEEIVQIIALGPAGEVRIRYKGTAFNAHLYSEIAYKYLKMMPEKPKIDISKQVLSPMPGLVRSISCKPGDDVAEGQEVCVIEAMKMQNSLNVTTTGKVKAVYVKVGETVEDEQVLVELE